jgi:PHD/YefM family antitoxin component YafN of YafNO toxin-antitoxin module
LRSEQIGLSYYKQIKNTPSSDKLVFRSDDIHPVTDFVRNHKRHQQHLRETGRPEVLTVNGTPELVLHDVRAYEREAEEARRLREENRALRDRLEELETLMALEEAYAEMQRGEGRPMEAALPALRERLGMGVAAR